MELLKASLHIFEILLELFHPIQNFLAFIFDFAYCGANTPEHFGFFHKVQSLKFRRCICSHILRFVWDSLKLFGHVISFFQAINICLDPLAKTFDDGGVLVDQAYLYKWRLLWSDRDLLFQIGYSQIHISHHRDDQPINCGTDG